MYRLMSCILIKWPLCAGGGAYDTQHHELIVKDWFLSGSEIIVSFFSSFYFEKKQHSLPTEIYKLFFLFFSFFISVVEFAFFFPEAHTLCVCFGEQGCVVPVRLNIHKVKANKQQQQQHKPQTKQNRDVTKEQTSCALPSRQ